jgi:hypothetical protein
MGIGIRASMRSDVKLNTFKLCQLRNGFAACHSERTRVEDGGISKHLLRVAFRIPVGVSLCLILSWRCIACPVGGRRSKFHAACTGLHWSNSERMDPTVNKTRTTEANECQPQSLLSCM